VIHRITDFHRHVGLGNILSVQVESIIFYKNDNDEGENYKNYRIIGTVYVINIRGRSAYIRIGVRSCNATWSGCLGVISVM
jgi:hypothetical protein